ncbi:Neuron navigator 3 like, partial [Actinidia chinensis var. chinensis]
MPGNARFEALGSPESGFVGSHPNGPRGVYPGSSLDRSGSFREVGENRMFGSGAGASRVNRTVTVNFPPLSHCLMLEPIVMTNQRYTREGELRRVLGFSVGSASEDNSFGAAHLRPSPVVVMEELKRYKESIIDTNKKARGRAKKLDEHLHKLSKYFEVVNSKKQQRNELSTNERSCGLNVKMGTQIRRNLPDPGIQREEDWAKNGVPNKRVRTSLAETRAECRINGLARQPLAVAKDRDLLKDSPGSDLVEEKIRKLPTGGEGWDKKMKRKRTGGTVFLRPPDGDGELKRPTHHKGSNESGSQSGDAHGFRSESSNGISGNKKLDGGHLPASSVARAMPKNEQEKVTLRRDFTAGLNKETLLAKGDDKLNIREDNHIVSPSPVTKGKASRAPRSGSAAIANSSPNIPRVSGAPENWEPSPGANKIHSVGGANNRKRAMTSGSSPSMAKWAGQRPQKITRARRVNLVSPVSNNEEMQLSSEGCSPSDFGARIHSSGMNDSHRFRGMVNGTQQFKVKLENVLSPARFCESEESGAGENRLKERVMDSGEVEEKTIAQNACPSVLLTRKSKTIIKEETSDAVRRQGRSGRGSSFSTASISPVREKLENTATTKPLRSTRPGSDRNRSKIGRPLKKLLDRKGFSRRRHLPNSGSPDFTGESDDDREELLSAANLARNASYHACSSAFWKKVEPIFASVSIQDPPYFSQQVDLVQEEISTSETFGSNEIDKSLQNRIESKESDRIVERIDQVQGFDALCGSSKSEGRLNKVAPLYQRVLSALIIEDEVEEVEENNMGRNGTLQYDTNDLRCDVTGGMEFVYESTFVAQTWKQCAGNRTFSCDGKDTSNRNKVIQNHPQDGELLEGESEFVFSEVGVLSRLSSYDLDGPQSLRTNGCGISFFDSQYEKMCMEDKLLLELQSLGLYLDSVPALDDTEDGVINQEIVQMKKILYQQIGRKKPCISKIYKSIQQGHEAEARELEQVGMDRLVELAYKKLLATRGSIASKWGIPKVSKQVALAFAKRTLARCQAYEDSGTSCFIEPALRDVFFAPRPQDNDAEPSAYDDLGVGFFCSGAELLDLRRVSLDACENLAHQSDKAFAISGPISNRGKKKEVLLDDVGGNAAPRPPSPLLGGVKGKRSEREREKDLSSKNTSAKADHPLLSNLRGERKSKTKLKQKTAQLSTSGNGFDNKFTETAHPVYPSVISSGDLVTNGINKKREVGLMSPDAIPQDSLNEANGAMKLSNLQLPELDSIDELGAGTDLDGNQDLISLLDFDEDGLQDLDLDGLAIPMDD